MYFGDTNIWSAYSKNLVDWNVVEEPILQPRKRKFDSRLIEPGPPPILTKAGILLLYNGANDDLVYASGQALFDTDDPRKLIARSDKPFFTATSELERKGQVRNVVFIEGLVWFNGRWLLYYGMGDSGIGVAFHKRQ